MKVSVVVVSKCSTLFADEGGLTCFLWICLLSLILLDSSTTVVVCVKRVYVVLLPHFLCYIRFMITIDGSSHAVVCSVCLGNVPGAIEQLQQIVKEAFR